MKIFILLIMILPMFAYSDIQCREMQISREKLGKVISDFGVAHGNFIPDHGDVIFRRMQNSCHYEYVVLPTKKSDPIWALSKGVRIILNPTGDIVATYPKVDFQCPQMNFTEDYFHRKLSTIRSNNSEFPKEPINYKVDFSSYYYCSYIYVEYRSDDKEKPAFIHPSARINTFFFDYLGDLYIRN